MAEFWHPTRTVGKPDRVRRSGCVRAHALVMSVAAAITAAVIRVCDYPSRIAAAEACRSELDALHVQLQFGTLTVTRAAERLAK